MPFECLLWLAQPDREKPMRDFGHGAPYYTMPPTISFTEGCLLCGRTLERRNTGGYLRPIFKMACASCEPLDALLKAVA